LGYEKLKKDQQITLFFNLPLVVNKMKIDLVVAQTEKTNENFMDFTDLMLKIYQTDPILNQQHKEYSHEFIRMFSTNAE
jgi:hypothetical protein